MKKNPVGNRLQMVKTICVAVALVFGTSLFAAGAFAEPGCGEKCMCQSNPMALHQFAGQLIPLSTNFCDGGDPMTPCNMESGQTSELPEFILASVGGVLPNAVGPTGIISDFRTDRHDFRSNDQYQLVREKFQSPPIYLQKLSFLI